MNRGVKMLLVASRSYRTRRATKGYFVQFKEYLGYNEAFLITAQHVSHTVRREGPLLNNAQEGVACLKMKGKTG